MKKIYPLFYLFSVIFIIVQVLIFAETDLPDWIRFYLKDFLVMPIVLTICLVLVQRIRKKSNIRLSLFTVLSVATFYTLYFEIILPKITLRYTDDLFDMLLYFCGSLLFYFLQDRHPPHPADEEDEQ